MEPKKITFSDKVFQANGRTYFIASSLAIGRAVYMEEAKIELETGVRVGQTTQRLMKVYDHLQKGKFADAVIECYNGIKAVDGFFERPAPVLRICACFINREDEDITTITEEQVRAKIEDWKAEGIGMESFFTLALVFIAEETADLKSFTEKLQTVAEEYRRKLAQNELNIPISV